MFQQLALIFAIVSFCLTITSTKFYEENSKILKSMEVEVYDEVLINMDYFLNSEELYGMMVGNMLGFGSRGIVFAAKFQNQATEFTPKGAAKFTENGKEVVIKVYFKQYVDDGYCARAYRFHKKLKGSKVGRYINDIGRIFKFSVSSGQIVVPYTGQKSRRFEVAGQDVCLYEMEKGTATTNLFFEAKNLKENTKKMVNFIVRVLEAFKILNSDMGYYHGDVKPGNLLFVINQSSGEYEPRLIDFDFTYLRTNLLSLKSRPLLYTRIFRPPELLNIIPGSYFSPDARVRTSEKTAYDAYSFDEKLREESYPVGKTILYIIDENKAYLDMDNGDLQIIKEIAEKMTNDELKDRISTKDAYRRAKQISKLSVI